MKTEIDARVSYHATCYAQMKKWLMESPDWEASYEEAFSGPCVVEFNLEHILPPFQFTKDSTKESKKSDGVRTSSYVPISHENWATIKDGIDQVLHFKHKRYDDISGTLTLKAYSSFSQDTSWSLTLEGGLENYGADVFPGFPGKLESTYTSMIEAYGLTKRPPSIDRTVSDFRHFRRYNPSFTVEHMLNSHNIAGAQKDACQIACEKDSPITFEFMFNHPDMHFEFSNSKGEYIFKHLVLDVYVIAELLDEGFQTVRVETHKQTKNISSCAELQSFIKMDTSKSLKARINVLKDSKPEPKAKLKEMFAVQPSGFSPERSGFEDNPEVNSSAHLAKTIDIRELSSLWETVEEDQREVPVLDVGNIRGTRIDSNSGSKTVGNLIKSMTEGRE